MTLRAVAGRADAALEADSIAGTCDAGGAATGVLRRSAPGAPLEGHVSDVSVLPGRGVSPDVLPRERFVDQRVT